VGGGVGEKKKVNGSEKRDKKREKATGEDALTKEKPLGDAGK